MRQLNLDLTAKPWDNWTSLAKQEVVLNLRRLIALYERELRATEDLPDAARTMADVLHALESLEGSILATIER